MKMFNICLIALLLFVSLSACNNETHNMNNQMPMGDDPNPTGVNSDISEMFPMDKVETYTQEQLEAIVQLECSMDELLSLCPTKYIYQENNTYRVMYFGETSVAVVLYYKEYVRSNQIHGCINSKETFENLQIGTPFAEVRTLDPDGVYTFLYTGRTDWPKVSKHFTTDRYIVFITFDDTTGCIANIRAVPAWQAEE